MLKIIILSCFQLYLQLKTQLNEEKKNEKKQSHNTTQAIKVMVSCWQGNTKTRKKVTAIDNKFNAFYVVRSIRFTVKFTLWNGRV